MAITYSQFLENATGNIYDDLISIVGGLGYTKIKKKSSFRFNVLIDGNRLDAMQKMEAAIKMVYPHAHWDENAGDSSIGAIVIDRYMVGASPASKQGKASAGLANEHTLFKMIEEITAGGPMHIVFKAGSKEFRVEDVAGYRDAGRDTGGRKKADIVLITKDNKEIPISLKKDKAEMWESADSYWWKEAKSIVDAEEKKGTVKREPFKNVFRLTPNLAKKADSREAKSVVFGNDILPNGCVLEKTFTGRYNIVDNTAFIDVTKIVTSLSDLKGDYEIYFLIRNDSSRKGSKIYPGLRVLAVKKTRINKNVRVVR